MARDQRIWLALRWVVAGIIAAHGLARLVHGGVDPFGVWLLTQGIPFGPVAAWAITLTEIVGSVSLALGRFVFPLSLIFSSVYLVGIAMVHWKAGWFVVGLGRNGMEFSVLLIACLLCVGFAARNARR